MKITRIQPVAPRGDGLRLLAYFDAELTDDIHLYGLKLLENSSHRRIVCAPQAGPRRTATFSLTLAEELTNLASQQYEAVTANDTNTQAA